MRQFISRDGIIFFTEDDESPELFLGAINGDHLTVPLNDLSAVALKTEEKIRYTKIEKNGHYTSFFIDQMIEYFTWC